VAAAAAAAATAAAMGWDPAGVDEMRPDDRTNWEYSYLRVE